MNAAVGLLLLLFGAALVVVGVMAPGAWAGTFVGLLIAAVGWLLLDGWLHDRRDRRRRARRPGYIDRLP